MWREALCALYIGIIIVAWNDLSFLAIFVSSILIYLVLFGTFYIWALYATGKRDFKALYRYLSLRLRINSIKRRNVGIPQLFQETVKRHPNKVAFYYEDEIWTFSELEDYSNRVANYFRKDNKVVHGSVVSLFMENRVQYVGIWLGISKLGGVPAFINTNLRQGPLAHCIDSVQSHTIIVGPDPALQAAIHDLKDDLKSVNIFVSAPTPADVKVPGAVDLETELKMESISSPDENIKQVKFGDKLCFIFTSGTTGLPKAAVIKHSRAIFAECGMFSLVGIEPSDVIYDPLPLYHTVGGIIGLGMCLVEGATIALRGKFSASNFWSDCVKYNCTVAQYIGEICRYLLNSPHRPEETKHQVRVMFGNGLRPQIWREFQDRFNIGTISEFYGATEGNANIINMDGKEGAIGFLSVILPSFYPCTLIKIDGETSVPMRDNKGLCIRCKPGEPGEFVGRIIRNDPVRDFVGYADKKATDSKIVRDVWKKGDAAFLSGDLLVMDDEGYLYFKDRLGDTFRWKGENVSTTEVEGIFTKFIKLADVAVYGVEIPGLEGRVGMAAIVDSTGKLDLNSIPEQLKKFLPAYAHPLFLRIVTKMDMTGTFKLKKTTLRKEAYDVHAIDDQIYFLDQKKREYVKLDKGLHEQIVKGEIRL